MLVMINLSHASIFNMQQSIIDWQKEYGRNHLPWQFTDPYTTWISEIMLQQTQVSTVIPYFTKFMRSYPNVSTLACATLDEVLTHWSGLGYYRRAHNLHAAAKIWNDRFPHSTPDTLEDWLSLPGIGRSTAGAIMSLAQGKKQAICDGNVKRVFSRYFGASFGELSDKEHWIFVHSLLPQENIRAYNQGLMDIGATLCLKTTPSCNICPLNLNCARFIPKPTTDKKIKASKAIRILHVSYHTELSKIALTQRTNKDIWPSLWFLPEIEPEGEADYFFLHELTHRTLHVHIHIKKILSVQKVSEVNDTNKFIDIADLKNIPRPSLLDLIVDHMQAKML